MRLFELASTSELLAKTSKRNAKLKTIAGVIAHAEAPDRGLVALYLSGSVAQDKLGVGYAQLGALREAPAAAEPSIEVRELDRTLSEVAAVRGPGFRRTAHGVAPLAHGPRNACRATVHRQTRSR